MTKFNIIGILILSLIAFAPVADAGCSCSGGTWDPYGFLNSDLETNQPVQAAQDSSADNSGANTQKPVERASTYSNAAMLKPMKSVSSSDVVIDVSNGDGYAASHIKDAIHIPSRNLLNSEGSLKTVDELADLLGSAGVSRTDSVVLYGSQESSGEAEFAYLVLRYLGQNEVKLLDGSLAEWKAAGLPEEVVENNRTGAEYKPQVRSDVMAEYDYVKSGQ
ncbi:MAG TPA: rhodanese-like domain-containing protein, partial [Methanothrix soehngenii]|nr:rhodanese-like domain-containing protein [Methanothrix soehngenii]